MALFGVGAFVVSIPYLTLLVPLMSGYFMFFQFVALSILTRIPQQKEEET